MKNAPIAIAIGLAAAVAAGALVLTTSNPVPTADDASGTAYFDDSAGTNERIRALELAVSEERRARQLLEEELLLLFAEIERLEGDAGEPTIVAEAFGNDEVVAVERVQQFRMDRSPEGRTAAMVEAGLTPERAAWILQREDELRYEAMRARFEARNSSEPRDRFDPALNPDSMLRAEIGDAEYEKYLEAHNRPTSVSISSVMASSPAANAGLQPGDQIVAYDGRRVFGTSDLIQQTMRGGQGNVVVDVTRNGSPMQIVVPRGPIGVEVGRQRSRRSR